MKKLFLVLMLCSAFLLIGNTASAYNILQLDIIGGSYINGDTVSTDPTPSVVALLNPASGNYGTASHKVNVYTTYYLSAALVPTESSYSGSSSPRIGSTTADNLASTRIAAYGTPTQLPTHSSFPTTYWEWSFNFDPLSGVTPYNVSDLPDVDPTFHNPRNSGDFYAAVFNFDVAGLLSEGYSIHYDLYGYDAGGAIHKAPFSHDASSAPEPATLLLFGSGLIGLVGFRKKLRKS